MSGGFVQVWIDTVEGVGDRLTPAQWGLILRLSARIGRQDTIPRHGPRRSGAPMTVQDIADMIGWSREHTSRQLSAIERETRLITIEGTGPHRYVVLSPSLVHRYARRTPRDDLP